MPNFRYMPPLRDFGDNHLGYSGNIEFTDRESAMNAKEISDYRNVPYTMFVDWNNIIRLNRQRGSGFYNMLSPEKEKEIEKHIINYQNANK